MGRGEIADLEAKLFDTDKRGCLAVLVGPRKRGEIDYELFQDGNARMKIGLKNLPVPDGTSHVTVLLNDTPVAELELRGRSGFVRFERARGDDVPEISVDDEATVQAGGRVVCSGTFHRD
jgi:hypothetical protein